MALPITGQSKRRSSQYRVAACAVAPVAPTADFANKLSLINQTEASGKQHGAVAIREAVDGTLNFMIATGDTSTATWLPLTAGTPLTPAPVAALSLSTDLPATKTAEPASDATFEVVAAGGYAPYTYQWFRNGVFIDPAINPTANTATLVNSAVTAGSDGSYWCVVTDEVGQVVESVHCALTVE